MKAPHQLKELVEDHIRSFLESELWQHDLYAPMAYILSLKAKRIRPVLALLAYQATSGERPEKALNLAMALEIFHNFTLVHDDIMDNAPVRRGMPTIHRKWDSSTAILSGDALFAVSMQLLIQDFNDKAAELVREFTRVGLGVCEGQMEDMRLAEKEEVIIPEYLEMIRKKTAMLLGGSLSLGAIAGGAEEKVAAQFYQYGEAAGIAFQLQDDYLDAFGPQESFGKQVGGDIIEGKRTFLLLEALKTADAGQRMELQRLLDKVTDPEEKTSGVLALYGALGIREKTQAVIHSRFEEAGRLGEGLAHIQGFHYINELLAALSKRKV